MDSLTQETKILNRIKSNGKKGAANWELSRIALCYTKVISNLRKDGYNIITSREFKNGRATGTFRYSLEESWLKKLRRKSNGRN